MRDTPQVRVEPDGRGTWAVWLGDVPVRDGLQREAAEEWADKDPDEIVDGTRFAHHWRNRRVAAERITGAAGSAADH